MNPWLLGIFLSAIAGVMSFRLLPTAWVLPMFGVGIAAALVFGTILCVNTKPRKPVHPAVEFALSLVNLPPDPLATVGDGWSLRAFAIAVTYVLSLALTMIWSAYA